MRDERPTHKAPGAGRDLWLELYGARKREGAAAPRAARYGALSVLDV
jgi:hypothetical protein